MKDNILITGGAGFVGSNLAMFLKRNLVDKNIICFDNLIRQGSELNVPRLIDLGIEFVNGDVRDRKKVLDLNDIDTIIDCAAEPSVLSACKEPVYTLDTNLLGTINCLELARRESSKFIFMSTNRVYPVFALEKIPFEECENRFDWSKSVSGDGYCFQGIDEGFTLNGHRSLYGASKLCSEHILTEYISMFDVKGVINRFGIIAGPWQMGKVDQGVVAYWLAKIKFGSKLNYVGFGGQGKQVRDVIHVDDVCDLVLREITDMDVMNNTIFNVGGGRSNSFSLKELTVKICDLLNVSFDVDSVLTQRNDDVRVYITNNKLVKEITGWTPKRTLEDILEDLNIWMDDNNLLLSEVFKGVNERV